MKFSLFLLCLVPVLFSCSVQKKMARNAKTTVLADPSIKNAHIGISVYDAVSGRYLYNYQGEQYFVPASNTKIPTCYAAMKYLGDSLEGLRVAERNGTLYLFPTADPTLLHPDYPRQPVMDFLRANRSRQFVFTDPYWKEEPWGSGWAWNDYEGDYMAERSALPVYGNLVTFTGDAANLLVTPAHFGMEAVTLPSAYSGYLTGVSRALAANHFQVRAGGKTSREIQVPFRTSDSLNLGLLFDTAFGHTGAAGSLIQMTPGASTTPSFVIHSQPTDSMLKPMMHRSDNFFAEQSLLMVSNRVLNVMSDARIIDTLLKTDFSDLPQKPRWVDGCGLSRYNLFTPQDFVTILSKMRSSFGMDRIRNIFATGNTGTLANYYKAEQGYLFAKTGTLSGVVALSGFLYTKHNRQLIFSILVNNHNSPATAVRRAVEKFVEELRDQY
jgi:serine-type D-Ala-D-Ala carboxypeptidase/endopeptidase (penicillin-binding protein 4)